MASIFGYSPDIKDYNRRSEIFTLGLPNTEVKEGLIDNLLPFYTSIGKHEAPVLVDDGDSQAISSPDKCVSCAR